MAQLCHDVALGNGPFRQRDEIIAGLPGGGLTVVHVQPPPRHQRRPQLAVLGTAGVHGINVGAGVHVRRVQNRGGRPRDGADDVGAGHRVRGGGREFGCHPHPTGHPALKGSRMLAIAAPHPHTRERPHVHQADQMGLGLGPGAQKRQRAGVGARQGLRRHGTDRRRAQCRDGLGIDNGQRRARVVVEQDDDTLVPGATRTGIVWHHGQQFGAHDLASRQPSGHQPQEGRRRQIQHPPQGLNRSPACQVGQNVGHRGNEHLRRQRLAYVICGPQLQALAPYPLETATGRHALAAWFPNAFLPDIRSRRPDPFLDSPRIPHKLCNPGVPVARNDALTTAR